MKRKIIRLGTATLVTSLPASWIKKHELKPGEELEVEERGRELFLSTKKSFSLDQAEIDVSKLDPIINRSIAAAYREGYNEIKITFDKPSLLDKIQKEVLNELIGFEIVEQGKNFCVIKEVSKPAENEFDKVIKRIFLLVESMGEEILSGIKSKETNLKHISYMDFNINKLANFCLRILNKKGYKDYKKTPTVYFIIISLEHLADYYKDFAEYITKGKVKLDKKDIELFNEIQNIFKIYKEIFHEFDDKKAVAMSKKWKTLMSKIKKDSNTGHYFHDMAYTIIRMLGNHLTISF